MSPQSEEFQKVYADRARNLMRAQKAKEAIPVWAELRRFQLDCRSLPIGKLARICILPARPCPMQPSFSAQSVVMISETFPNST